MTDDNGVWQPQGIHHLRVAVKNGELLGLGSANPYVKGNYTEDTVRTYFGEAMAVVRAGESGSLRSPPGRRFTLQPKFGQTWIATGLL